MVAKVARSANQKDRLGKRKAPLLRPATFDPQESSPVLITSPNSGRSDPPTVVYGIRLPA